MRGLIVVLVALAACASASAGGWSSGVLFTNSVASSPVKGGGYPVPAGATAPTPGTCRLGDYNSNRSESWIAVKPGTEDLVGVSKFFFERWSTFYDFHLGSYSIPNGTPGQNAQVTGYDCISTGSQEMPPSWTNNTDPNVDFDSQGRAYQVTLPFNAYWVNLHPNGGIGVVYSDDLGRSWKLGNGGELLAHLNNSSSFSFGDVVDKQWVAVNHVSLSPYRDHVYAMWSVFNGVNETEIWFSKSTDRGQTFTAPVRITPPNVLGPANTYIYPSVDAAGNLYASVASFKASGSTDAELWVAKSTDDGATFTWFDTGAHAVGTPGDDFPNTTFRDGILENFAASPAYPGHLYLTYEAWDGSQMDIKFTQSTDGGATWSTPVVVNDPDPNDQLQPSVAAGPGGAVAVAFYDRRQACPSGKSIRPEDVGRTNFCIDLTLQAYKDAGGGAGAAPVLGNVRISDFTWDPMEPAQHVGGIGQIACASHADPCLERAFIGDYFGLAISNANIYALSVSTHYPSRVKADEGGSVYYQQQVLATVPRSEFGSGF